MLERLKNFINAKRQSCRPQQQLPEFRLVPQGASKGTVALNYIVWPFIDGWDSPKACGHTNAFEVVTIAEAYRDLGYIVEIVDYQNNHYLPPSDCCVAIDLHGQLERWNHVLPKECLRILHATGAHWLACNQSELTRLAAVRDRKGVALYPRRSVRPSNSATFMDHLVVIGNEYMIDSFAFAKKPVTRVPLSSAYEFPWPEKRNFSLAKKKFLWLGSSGMVHKGLDLVLEAFAQMPELSLTVCGRPEQEDDFYRLYQRELFQTPNITLHGWADLASPEFLEIANTHVASIFPSCSEGCSGSLIHSMHAALVPVCTYESGVDLKDFGILIQEGTVKAVMEAARKFAALSDEEVEQRASASYAYAREHHTREQFQKNYRAFAESLLNKKTVTTNVPLVVLKS